MIIAYSILEVELKTLLRHFSYSVKERFASTTIIFILSLVFLFIFVKLSAFVIDNPKLFPEGSNEGYGTVLMIFFALFTIRSAGTTYRRVIKSKVLELYLVQPVSTKQIMRGMLFSVIIPNFLLSFLLLFFFQFGNVVSGTNIFVPHDFLILFLLFSILAPLCGFMFSIIGSLHPFSHKAKFLVTLSPFLIIQMFMANNSHIYPAEAKIVGLFSLFLLLIFLHNMDKILVKAFDSSRNYSSTHKNTTRFFQFKWLNAIIGIKATSICSKEVISSIRERDVLSSAISTFSIALVLIFWWFKAGLPSESIGNLPPELYYPGILAISMYLGALLQCTMLGSTILGVEGKRLWIMKSNPVESLLVMRGKAAALILMSIPGMLFIWLPICILAKFPFEVSIFFGECLLILIFSNTGLGIWSGSAFANFDERDRGNPDILVQFMLMGTSALFSSILLILPATVMLLNFNLGLVAGLIFVLVSYGILLTGIQSGSFAYKSIFINNYGI